MKDIYMIAYFRINVPTVGERDMESYDLIVQMREICIIVYIRSIYVPSVQVRVMCTAAYIRSICSLSAVERDKYDTLHKRYMSLQFR